MIYKFLPDVKIAWRRRLGRERDHRAAVHRGQVRDRAVPRPEQLRLGLRGGGLARGPARLDLLLVADPLLRRRVHEGLREPEGLADRAPTRTPGRSPPRPAPTRGSRRREHEGRGGAPSRRAAPSAFPGLPRPRGPSWWSVARPRPGGSRPRGAESPGAGSPPWPGWPPCSTSASGVKTKTTSRGVRSGGVAAPLSAPERLRAFGRGGWCPADGLLIGRPCSGPGPSSPSSRRTRGDPARRICRAWRHPGAGRSPMRSHPSSVRRVGSVAFVSRWQETPWCEGWEGPSMAPGGPGATPVPGGGPRFRPSSAYPGRRPRWVSCRRRRILLSCTG